MQVDPIKPRLKAPGRNLLTLKPDELLSSFAFNLNLRHYDKGKLRQAANGQSYSVWKLGDLSPTDYTITVRRATRSCCSKCVVVCVCLCSKYQLLVVARQAAVAEFLPVRLPVRSPEILRGTL